MSRKQKRVLLRIIISVILFGVATLISFSPKIKNAIYLAAYLIIGYDILKKAIKGVFNRQLFDENFLMAIATLGALLLAFNGRGDFTEAVAVMLFYQIGELFQSIAVGKSRRNIAALMDIRPEFANVEKGDVIEKVSPEDVETGSIIVVKPGERIPIDSIVVQGASSVDTSAVSGESIPQDVGEGDRVISGCVNINGVLRLRTEKAFGESAVCRILNLVENATSRKAKSEKFISKFARIYTPAVCALAFSLAVIPPFFEVLSGGSENWGEWFYRALTFLVVSCPCALVISIPLSFFSGIGGASRAGVLIKGSNFMEVLSKADCVVFDKTGTLTEGAFKVRGIHAENGDSKKLIEIAALAESASSHPIANSIKEAYGKEIDEARVKNIREIPGKGILATIDNKNVSVGNRKLMKDLDVPCNQETHTGTIVYVCVDGKYIGCIIIGDIIKKNSKKAIEGLKRLGIKKTVMLTGDNEKTAADVAEKVGIDIVHSELLPENKVEEVEKLISRKEKGSSLIFVGDGINDAPVLSRADVGIAMGALGSQAAIEAADVVLTDDNPQKIALAIRISRKCIGIVYQNIAFAIGVKLICLTLTAAGITGMWLAIFADVGVMVLAVLNAMRALNVKRN